MTLATALVFVVLGQAAASDVPPAPARVGSHVSEPRKLKQVAPKYPDAARRAGLAQAVVLECLVDPRGLVSKVDVLEGVPPLTDAAIGAVKQWRYSPTLLDRVTRCRVLQSVPELDAAALAAVREWQFEPARRGGQPIATIVHMPVVFRIDDMKR